MRRLLVLILFTLCAAAGCTAEPTAVPPTLPAPQRVLESWKPQQDKLSVQDAQRAWRFDGQAGDPVRLRLDAKAGGQVTLLLQDGNGQTVAQGADLNVTLPANGTYTALVQLVAGEGTTYSLLLSYADRGTPSNTPTLTPSLTPSRTPSMTFTPSITFTPSNTPTATLTPTPIYAPLGTLTGHLEVGQTVAGSYLSQFERHIYTFTGTAGAKITLSMKATSGTVDPTLTLFDPTGQPMATDDNSGGDHAALLRDILLPVDGEYIVQALGGVTGDYQISLQATAPPPPDQATPTATAPLGTTTPVAAVPELADHVLMLGLIDRPGAFNRYFIDAQAGSIVTISVRPVSGSSLQPHIEVYTPAGELMTSQALGSDGQASIPGLGVIEAGKYGVFISADGGSSGAYTIAYGSGDTNQDNLRGSVPPEQQAAGGDQSLVRDEWTLPLIAGDVIGVDAHGAALQVVAPDGATVARAESSVQFSASSSGDYRVYATGAAYSFLWRHLVSAPTPQAPLLILSAIDPLPPQTYLNYPFQGAAGREVHIHVDALNDGVDPVAALLDPDGKDIADGDDSPNSMNPDFDTLLPVAGTYTLRVNDYNNTGGSVSVRVEVLS